LLFLAAGQGDHRMRCRFDTEMPAVVDVERRGAPVAEAVGRAETDVRRIRLLVTAVGRLERRAGDVLPDQSDAPVLLRRGEQAEIEAEAAAGRDVLLIETRAARDELATDAGEEP